MLHRTGATVIGCSIAGLAVDACEHFDLNLPDPDEEPFLAVALAASVDFPVTGNVSDYPPDKRRECSRPVTVAYPVDPASAIDVRSTAC